MSVKIVSGEVVDRNPPVDEHTFRELVAGREEEFPILAAAAARSDMAHQLDIAWTDPTGRQRFQNHMQIVRAPYDGRPVEEGSQRDAEEVGKEQALTAFLTACETILRDGVPYSSRASSGLPIRSCGGLSYYLGRKTVLIGDTIKLWILREPMYRLFEWRFDDDGNWVPLERPTGEWLAEFSLQVSA